MEQFGKAGTGYYTPVGSRMGTITKPRCISANEVKRTVQYVMKATKLTSVCVFVCEIHKYKFLKNPNLTVYSMAQTSALFVFQNCSLCFNTQDADICVKIYIISYGHIVWLKL